MSFLTIEKFTPHSRARVIKKIILAFFLLVVPFAILAAWAFLGMMTNSGFFLAQAAVGINKQINYQGKIANSSGNNLTDGNYNFKFELYDAPESGTLLWSEEWKTGGGAGPVTLTDSIFSVALGTSTALTASLFNNDRVYLQVYLDADSNGTYEETFSPRKRITASPYAFNSDAVDGYDATTTATANQLLVLDSMAGLTLNGVTTTGTFYAGGYASSTGGLFTQGNGHFGGSLTVGGNTTTTGLTVDTGAETQLKTGNLTLDLTAVTPGLYYTIPVIESTASTTIAAPTLTHGLGIYDDLYIFDKSADKSVSLNFGSMSFSDNAQITADFNNNYLTANFDWNPSEDDQYDLGRSDLRWKDLWLSGNATTTGTAYGGFGSYFGDTNSNYWRIESYDAPAGRIAMLKGSSINGTVRVGGMWGGLYLVEDTNNSNPLLTFYNTAVNSAATIAFATTSQVLSYSAVNGHTFNKAITVDDNTQPIFTFDSDTGSTYISYNPPTDVLSFNAASGGYVFDNKVTVSADLAVSGNATTSGYLTVGTAPAGANFTAGNLNVQNNIVAGGYASSTTGLFTQGNLHVGGAASFDGTISGVGFTTAWNILYNATTTLNGFTPANYLTLATYFATTTWAGGNNNLTVIGYASSTAGLYTQGAGHFGGSLTVDGNASSTHFAASEICLNGSCQTAWPAGGTGTDVNWSFSYSANTLTPATSTSGVIINGNVGINTSTPNAKLVVDNGAVSDGGYKFENYFKSGIKYDNSLSDDYVSVLGIASTTDLDADVAGSVGVEGVALTNGSVGVAGVGLNGGSGGAFYSLSGSGNGLVAANVDPTGYAFISSAGLNLFVGTTTFSADISVGGNATTSGYLTVGTAPAGANFSNGNLNIQNNLVVGNGITLGGVTLTAWPTGGSSAGSFWATSTDSLVGYPILNAGYAITVGTDHTSTPGLKFEVLGNTKLNGDSLFAGNATTSGYLTVGEAPTGANFASGNLNLQKNLIIGGSATSSGSVYVTNSLGLNSEYFSDLTGLGLTNYNNTLRVNTSTLKLTTDAISEGVTNLYWTPARFDTRLSATSTLPNLWSLPGLGVIGSSTATTTFPGNVAVTGNISVGTIIGGTWNGSVLGVSYGGTGLASTPTNGQLLIGNGTGYTLAGLTGTANQLTVTNGAGAITLSLPQNIDLAASPTFSTLTLSSTTANTLVVNTNNLVVDALNGRVGIGTAAPAAKLNVLSTTEQLRLSYDGSNYFKTTVGSTGSVTFDAVGGVVPLFTFSDAVSITGNLTATTIVAPTVWNGATIGVGYGGTGLTSYTTGQILYASAAGTLAGLSDVAAGSYLRSGGVATAPLWSTLTLPNAGTAYRLPVFSATNVMTELAAAGTTGQYLSGATGAIPAWATLNQAAVAGLTTASSPTFAGLTLNGALVMSGSAANINLGSNYLSGDGGDEGVFVNSTGKVGIGTGSPGVQLDVQGAANTTYTNNPRILNIVTTDAPAAGMGAGLTFGGAYSGDDTTLITQFAYIGGVKENAMDYIPGTTDYAGKLVFGTRAAGAGTADMTRMTILSSGNVGIATTTPTRALSVVGQIFTSQDGSDPAYWNTGGFVTMDNNNGKGWFFAQRSAKANTTNLTGDRNTFRFAYCENFNCSDDGALEVMAFMPSGNVGVGTTSPSTLLQVGSSSFTSANMVTIQDANGTCTLNPGSGASWSCSSDLRLKKEVIDLNGSLEQVLALRPVSFKMQIDDSDGIGFLAQEIQAIMPDAVSQMPDGYLGVDSTRIIPRLVGAIKEQQLEIGDLQDLVSSSLSNPAFDDANLTVSNEVPSLVDTLQVRQAASFHGTITVYGEAGFVSKVTFEKEVEFKDHLAVDADTAGTARVAAGATSTEITFNKEYASVPKVVANLQVSTTPLFVQWGIADKSVKGFKIVLSEPMLSDLEFDWVALANKASGQVAGQQEQAVISGCTNPQATNYNPVANQDNGSCVLIQTPEPEVGGSVPVEEQAVVSGCTDPQATNYNVGATQDDGSCVINTVAEPSVEVSEPVAPPVVTEEPAVTEEVVVTPTEPAVE